MLTDVKKHLTYYLSLGAILASGIFFASQAYYDKQLQMMIVVATAFVYVLWGILHHLMHHDLNSKIVVEYILISAFGMAVILFILRGFI